MKKLLMIFAGLLIYSNLVFAISSDLKLEYEKGETIIAEISGNIIEPLESSQVEFKRGHVLVPFEYDLIKLEDKWFLWAMAPSNENNYSLVIKNIVTIVSGKSVLIDYMQNFSVRGNLTDYSIRPGFFFTRGDFEVSVQLNEDTEKKINVDFPYEREIVLKPGKTNIKFSIDDSNKTGFIKINIGKYTIPAYIIKEPRDKIVENITLRLEPKEITSTAFIGDEIVYPFQIINNGKNRDNIRIDYNKEIFRIDKDRIVLEPNEGVELNLSFVGELNEEIKKEGINETISVYSDKFLLLMSVIIKFTEKREEAKTDYLENYAVLSYCSQLKGIVCTAGEICDAKVEVSSDGACCLGKCMAQGEGRSKAWIGYVIVVIISILILYVFIKYRRTKPKV